MIFTDNGDNWGDNGHGQVINFPHRRGSWHDDRVHSRVPRRVRPATIVLALMILTAGVLLSGCVRMKAAMAVSDDDHVSGQIVAGTITGGSDATLVVPPSLRDRATVQPYSADGYAGSQLDFSDLTFEELRTLMAASPEAAQRYQFGLHRSGNVLTLSSAIDLTALEPAKADLGVKINFPGKITASNGSEDQDGTITWTPQPGKVNELTATVITSNSGLNPLLRWGLLVGGLAGVVALIVIVLAVVARRRSLHSTH